jgi:3-hydroxy-9,10-secoandrosta-1,3,5(10)-triene-9,17-dione monooxygenase reductase component
MLDAPHASGVAAQVWRRVQARSDPPLLDNLLSTSVTDSTDPTAFDSKQFRNVLGHFPTGVTVVSGMDADDPVGFTIGSFTSVSLDPPLVGFLPAKDSPTWDAMAHSGSFCVNVLSREQADLCWKFAKSDDEQDRFADTGWHAAPSGSPIIDRAVAWIDCDIEEVYEMGDHIFVLGRVTALEADADNDGEGPFPLLFFKGTLGGFESEG